MLIAYLAALGPKDRFCYQRLSDLAKEMGSDIRFVRAVDYDEDSVQSAWTAFAQLLREADAFFMPDDTVAYSEEYTEQLYERVEAGSRLLVRLDENYLDRQNAFLSKFDLTGTRVRIRSVSSRLVTLRRSADTFRDVRLFGGVEEVEVQQPNAIWYGGESLPVLVADNQYLAINGETDLPSDWNARELACAAAWHGAGQGGVLAMSGAYFSDPYEGATGVHWPGIEPNMKLARNVLQYLAEGRSHATPEDRCQRIEINLADFVFGVLKRSSQEWWTELVPLTIRQKCAQRQEEERNRLPKEAYFDLIDLKTVMHKNWSLFEPFFQAASSTESTGGKDKSLAWLDKLNELRRLVGHPLKKHVSGYSFTVQEQELLRTADELAKRLVDNFRGSTP